MIKQIIKRKHRSLVTSSNRKSHFRQVSWKIIIKWQDANDLITEEPSRPGRSSSGRKSPPTKNATPQEPAGPLSSHPLMSALFQRHAPPPASTTDGPLRDQMGHASRRAPGREAPHTIAGMTHNHQGHFRFPPKLKAHHHQAGPMQPHRPPHSSPQSPRRSPEGHSRAGSPTGPPKGPL